MGWETLKVSKTFGLAQIGWKRVSYPLAPCVGESFFYSLSCPMLAGARKGPI